MTGWGLSVRSLPDRTGAGSRGQVHKPGAANGHRPHCFARTFHTLEVAVICNGVIDAQRMFAERRDRAETGRDSDRVKAEATEKHGVVFE